MGARRKLNVAYFHGSLVLAALAGGLSTSWGVFALTLTVLVSGNIMAGDIRGPPRRRGQQS